MKYLTPPVFWPVWIIAQRSQRRACRNAKVATTALTARRHEREDTEEFVGGVLSRRSPVADAVLPARDHDAARHG